ncbi:hypothetical protein [Candidatus Vidania fulgoroideorum]
MITVGDEVIVERGVFKNKVGYVRQVIKKKVLEIYLIDIRKIIYINKSNVSIY